MIVDEQLWELIHEYKLVELQAKVHMANGNIDSYIDCLDMLTKIRHDIEVRERKLNGDYLLIIRRN